MKIPPDLNYDLHDPPILIAMSGLTGTGKSTVAAALAERMDLACIRSDVVRKELAGIKKDRRGVDAFGEGIYSEEFFEVTYEELFKRAVLILKKRRGLIIDASFKKRSFRDRVRAVAGEMNMPFLLVECFCSEEEVFRRLKKRALSGKDVSNGRWEIYQKQKGDFDAVDELKEIERIVINTELDMSDNLNMIASAVIRLINKKRD